MHSPLDTQRLLGRRAFLGANAQGIGLAALGSLLTAGRGLAAATASRLPGLPHFAPKAKRVLCLFQSEGFSHVDLFDYKPTLTDWHGQEIPPSVNGPQRLPGITSGQGKSPVVAPLNGGRRCGQHGTWISDLLPHMQKVTAPRTVLTAAAAFFERGDDGVFALAGGHAREALR